jgi:AraC family transcriptional regulator of arabinose operon
MEALPVNLDTVPMPVSPIASQVLSPQPTADWQLLRVGHLVCPPNYRIDRTRYPGHEWLLCLTGRGSAWCGEARCAVGPGDLVWLDNRQPHGHAADPSEPWELLWLRCAAPALDRWRVRLGGDRCLRSTLSDPATIAAELRDLLRLAEEQAATNSELWEARVQAALTGLLARIVGNLLQGNEVPLDPPIARCQASMLADLSGRWPSRRLVRVAGLPSASLYRRFRQSVGLAPLAWLRQRRMEAAARLLHGHGRTVSTIAATVGYADPFHFSRDFRATFGVSPRAFRRAESGGPG